MNDLIFPLLYKIAYNYGVELIGTAFNVYAFYSHNLEIPNSTPLYPHMG